MVIPHQRERICVGAVNISQSCIKQMIVVTETNAKLISKRKIGDSNGKCSSIRLDTNL